MENTFSGKTLTSYCQRNIALGKAPNVIIRDGVIDSTERDEWIAQRYIDHPISYDEAADSLRPHHRIFINESTDEAVLKWWEPVTFTYP